ncbi:hypothetical protein CEF21_18865 [Bacillus sp. FJAT-42376]|uniref:DinB family protein n=1 Tax=Bacillus sp. FJAT-42376 TaxID=2014076 RepID=UPI000F4DF657|nr:DinB family protein [Bacillus sp. FJAT-42376]AZB44186.1 hypothetical protein CEF21_18865 [Bacillus sp. FJAT-42376]
MFKGTADFLNEWKYESGLTQKVLDGLTDDSLNQEVSPGLYSIGSLAWHITGSLYYFPSQIGIEFEHPDLQKKGPESAAEITDTYNTLNSRLVKRVSEQLTDEKLDERMDLFGREMSVQDVLHLLIQHQAHHRAQLTVLMRQAGLKVPGMYGPSKEEWEAMNA